MGVGFEEGRMTSFKKNERFPKGAWALKGSQTPFLDSGRRERCVGMPDAEEEREYEDVGPSVLYILISARGYASSDT